ncbi:MAG TPA: amino acid permease [Terriglobales bacterium]|nr:amino acid permease [Terriglobales bacterium]
MTTQTQTEVRVPASSAPTEFVKAINLTSATTLVIGSMIGSGIFIVSADISRTVNSPALLILAWVVTGFMTIVGALTYGELAAMMPKAGGQYIFLRESLGPLWGFLYGWAMFLVIQTGTIAAVGVAFGKFLGVLFPAISADKWLWHIGHVPKWSMGPMVLGNMDVGVNLQNLVAIGTVIFLTAINVLGVRTGTIVQNIFTFAKTAALVGLVLLGAAVGANHQAIAANFGHFWRNASFHDLHAVQVGIGGPIAMVGLFTVIAVVQTGSLFSSDAWNNVTFTAAEVENPKRNLPLSLALGTSIVILLYIAANFVYLMVLPLHGDPHGATLAARGIQYAADDRVATAVMQSVFGSAGAVAMAIAILVSTFGCSNGLILAGARIYYAMAKDGLFFRSTAKLHPKFKTPAISLLIQAVWTCLLCLSGTYSQLLDLTMFTVIIFYILTIGGLFVLRRTRPDAPRPYRAIGYPVLPAIYILLAVFIDVVLLRYKPQYTWPGLIIVLLGIPVYLFWSRKANTPAMKLHSEVE